jgi:hypothetical protein
VADLSCKLHHASNHEVFRPAVERCYQNEKRLDVGEKKLDLTSPRRESIIPSSPAVAVLGSMAQVKRLPLLHVVGQ